MKRKIFLTESELVKLALTIAEQTNFDAYDDEDFLDAFFQLFRNYIKRYKGAKSLDYPMSYLLKRYSVDFVKDTLGEDYLKNLTGWEEGDDLDELLQDWVISQYDAKRIVTRAIEQQRYNLPKLVQQERFTEKYKTIIDNFITEGLELPDYVTVVLDEPNPHTFVVKTTVDFQKWIKDPKEVRISSSTIENKLKKFLQDYLGLDFGYIKYGQSEIGGQKIDFVGVDSWVKNELNKKIKKELKTLPDSRYVKAIRFKEPKYNKAELELVFHSDTRWNSKNDIVKEYKEKLLELGYGPNLEVDKV